MERPRWVQLRQILESVKGVKIDGLLFSEAAAEVLDVQGDGDVEDLAGKIAELAIYGLFDGGDSTRLVKGYIREGRFAGVEVED